MGDQSPTTCKATTSSGSQCKNSAGADGYCHISSHGSSDDTQDADELSPQRQRFVEEYCIDFNASAAARRAGYSEDTAGQQGYRLLKNVQIAEAVSRRLERHGMSAAEATARMADMARADLRAFTMIGDDGRLSIDLSTEEAQAMLHVVKEIKQTEQRYGKDEEVLERKTEIKLHDAKDALHKILQAHGAYTDRVDITSKGEALGGMDRDQARQRISRLERIVHDAKADR